MSVYKPKNSPFYHFDFWVRGHRFYGSTDETERRRAETVEAAERRKAVSLSATNKGGMTFDQAAARYWEEVGQHKTGAEEIDRNLERLVVMVGPGTLIANIDDNLLAKLISNRRMAVRWGRKGDGAKPVSAATVNRQITQLLRPILIRARKIWKIQLPDEPDWSEHLLAEPKERVRELKTDEEARLEKVERGDYRLPRQFAQITGLRLREVVGLTWGQIDFGERVINVVGKGDRPHTIPLTTQLRELLHPLRGNHPEMVFTFVAERTRTCGKTGQKFIKGVRYPITYWGMTTRRKRDFAKAEIKDFRFHDLRHTAATRIVRATGNLKVAKELLGHSDIRTTAKYAHAMLDDVREAMNQVAADEPRRKESRKKSRSELTDKENGDKIQTSRKNRATDL